MVCCYAAWEDKYIACFGLSFPFVFFYFNKFCFFAEIFYFSFFWEENWLLLFIIKWLKYRSQVILICIYLSAMACFLFLSCDFCCPWYKLIFNFIVDISYIILWDSGFCLALSYQVVPCWGVVWGLGRWVSYAFHWAPLTPPQPTWGTGSHCLSTSD